MFNTDPMYSRLEQFRLIVAALPPREREVFAKLIEGQTNREMAIGLGVSPRTIEAHRRSLMIKLGVAGNEVLLTRLATKAGF